MRLTHVRVLVEDLPACFRFYRDVLGLEVTWGDEDDGCADFRAGEAAIAVMQRGTLIEINESIPMEE